jgi:hypothetical protein
LDEYRLLPAKAVPAAALLIPLLELGVAVCLLIPAGRVVGAAFSVVLLTVFTVAIVLNIRAGRRTISCACFGSDKQVLGWDLVARNAMLAGVGVAVAVADPPNDQVSFAGAIVGIEALVLGLLIVGSISMFAHVNRLAR